MMRKILIVLIGSFVLGVGMLHAQGLYLTSTGRYDAQKQSTTYVPTVGTSTTLGAGSSRPAASFHLQGMSLSSGEFTTADSYLSGVTVATPSAAEPTVRRSPTDPNSLDGALIPLPDGMWVLLLLAAGYLGCIMLRKQA